MNELYKTDPDHSRDARHGNSRRWMYMSLAVLAAVILLWFMQDERTVRLAYSIRPDNRTMMKITLPQHCRVRTVYLRGNETVPRTGKLLTLMLNGEALEVKDWESLPQPSKVEHAANEECRTPPGSYPSPEPGSQWEITVRDVNPEIQSDALVLIVEVTGPEDVVKEWHNIVQLKQLPE